MNMNFVIMENIDPSQNMARYYVLTVDETLFGDTSLTRRWGRLGSWGQERTSHFPDRAQALESLEMWLRRKQRRGYSIRSAVE